jgi:Lrp/AsnC family leucine-responsive transcriptional regulator
MERLGIITGYTAQVDPVALQRTLIAFISIRVSSLEQDETTLNFMRNAPEIISCWSIAGDASYLAKVQVGNTADLESLISRLRSATNVLTVTTVVLSTIFAERPLVNFPD